MSLHEACAYSIYSNMRDNLFKYLKMIGLFDYLAGKTDYWARGDYYTLWQRIFNDLGSSLTSGIQVTQACNCAILRKTGKKSRQSNKTVFMSVERQYQCLLRHLRISPNLRLVIFLDTPFGQGFHQVALWEKLFGSHYPTVPVISITHPSSENSSVYNYLGQWDIMKDQRKRPNAERLFNSAKATIASLR